MEFEPTFLMAVIQTVSSGLILVCLWFAKTMWARIKEIEEAQVTQRLELERKLSELKLDTTTRIVALEMKVESIKIETID